MIDESFYSIPGVDVGFSHSSAVGDRPLPAQQKRMAPPTQNKRASQYRKTGSGQDFSDPVDNLNYLADKFGAVQQQLPRPGFDRFGGLRPFEHHSVPEEIKDHFQYAGLNQDRQDHPPPDWQV